VGSTGIVDLEIKRIAANDAEEYVVAVQADATEHATGGNPFGTGELFEHPLQIMILDSHGLIGESAECTPRACRRKPSFATRIPGSADRADSICNPREREARGTTEHYTVVAAAVAASTTATADISTNRSGAISRLTSTIVVAGRTSAKTSPCTRPTASHWSISHT